MPKIRDLGINVIPETMRPPEIGGGAGGGCEGGATYECQGTLATCTAGTLTTCLPGTIMGCTAGTLTTCLPGTVATCTAGTRVTTVDPYNAYAQCTPGTVQNCTPGTVYEKGNADYCTPGTRVTTPQITYLAAMQTGQAAADGLTREAIEILKQQLQKQIAQLDELAQCLVPKAPEGTKTEE